MSRSDFHPVLILWISAFRIGFDRIFLLVHPHLQNRYQRMHQESLGHQHQSCQCFYGFSVVSCYDCFESLILQFGNLNLFFVLYWSERFLNQIGLCLLHWILDPGSSYFWSSFRPATAYTSSIPFHFWSNQNHTQPNAGSLAHPLAWPTTLSTLHWTGPNPRVLTPLYLLQFNQLLHFAHQM